MRACDRSNLGAGGESIVTQAGGVCLRSTWLTLALSRLWP